MNWIMNFFSMEGWKAFVYLTAGLTFLRTQQFIYKLIANVLAYESSSV